MTDYPDSDFFDDHDTYDRIYCDEQTDDEYLWDDFSPDPYASVDNFYDDFYYDGPSDRVDPSLDDELNIGYNDFSPEIDFAPEEHIYTYASYERNYSDGLMNPQYARSAYLTDNSILYRDDEDGNSQIHPNNTRPLHQGSTRDYDQPSTMNVRQSHDIHDAPREMHPSDVTPPNGLSSTPSIPSTAQTLTAGEPTSRTHVPNTGQVRFSEQKTSDAQPAIHVSEPVAIPVSEPTTSVSEPVVFV